MNKIVILKDNNTGEDVYPTIPSTLVVDENGNNICGIVETVINNFNESLNIGINKIKEAGLSIKKLNGLNSSSEQEKLSSCTVDNNTTTKRLSILTTTSTELNNELSKNNTINKLTDDIYNCSDIISLGNKIIQERNYIQHGTPSYAPVGKEIRVDGENLYIGVNGVWYVINKTK